ncbi:solute carrier family 39 (zinc transporter), member 1/2/3 [Entomortierella parvispora]|uniref:Solute carrier family 39 (Zinc transporter), member 1/2/3 n=1 Tax=Entomortierella parvispora TaxID=205924 RepID=A0A9P3LZI4_9FUNG|nr:solute carrier family 39 (zinc transporter), member 1/2/3 [Entomortierella parvispora]
MSDNSTLLTAVADYDVPLHVGGLFANMAASALGVLFPILFTFTRFNAKTTAKIHSVIQTTRIFGSGVILATAFIHMLPSAFESLTDPSLPAIFQDQGYSAWAGLIAMLAALMLHLLEFVATQRFFQRTAPHRQNEESGLANKGLDAVEGLQQSGKVHAMDRLHDLDSDVDEKKHRQKDGESDSLEGVTVAPFAPVPSAQEVDPCVHHGHVHGGDILLINKHNQQAPHHNHGPGAGIESSPSGEDDATLIFEKEEREKRSRVIGTYILEFGIALHSVIIGISLATTVGSAFISLLIALLFHQFFEGVALGGRIASLKFKSSAKAPWLLSAWFACSTPLGIALGIGIRSTYNGDSVTALIVQGVFDSCSAGILLYTAMVQLMCTEMNANIAFRESSKKHQVNQFIALWLGSACMAVIGKWA